MGRQRYYPFDEGDTYYTVEDGQVVESTWDFVSEEMYDDVSNNTKYFHSYRSAQAFLLFKDISKTIKEKIV